MNVTDPTGLFEYTDGYGTWDIASVAGATVVYGNLERPPGQSGDGVHPKSVKGTEVERGLVGRSVRVGYQQAPPQEDPIYRGRDLPMVYVTASRPLLILSGLFANRFNHWQPTGTGYGLSVNPLFPQQSDYAEGVSDIVWSALSPVLLGVAGGGEASVGGGRALVRWFKGLGQSLQGGRTFAQYRSAYWAVRTKPIYQPIRLSNGNVFKVHMELHHRFIPQRATWAPNWLKNNSLNLQPLNTIEHGLKDPYRFRFFPKEIKQAIKSGNTFGY